MNNSIAKLTVRLLIVSGALVFAACDRGDDKAGEPKGPFSGAWQVTGLKKTSSTCEIEKSGSDAETLQVEHSGSVVTATSSDADFKDLVMKGKAGEKTFSIGASLGARVCDPPAVGAVPIVYEFRDIDLEAFTAKVAVSVELSCPNSENHCKATFQGQAKRVG